jgi:hypothetical protein
LAGEVGNEIAEQAHRVPIRVFKGRAIGRTPQLGAPRIFMED